MRPPLSKLTGCSELSRTVVIAGAGVAGIAGVAGVAGMAGDLFRVGHREREKMRIARAKTRY